MLSFRFQLTSAQLDLLLLIYAGQVHPSTVVMESANAVGSAYSYPHFVPIVSRLIDKGLVLHIERPVKEGERSWTVSGKAVGYVCTSRGRVIAQLAVEAAQKMLALAAIAEQRGLDVSAREEGVA